jgi:hypothetical protein
MLQGTSITAMGPEMAALGACLGLSFGLALWLFRWR